MEFITIWLIFALIIGAWSRHKGESFIAGFFFSLILSPLIAGLIVAFRSPDNLVIEKRRISNENMKKCPTCAELVKFEALKCRFCGQDLSQEVDRHGIAFDGKYYTIGGMKFMKLKHAIEESQKSAARTSRN